MKTLVAAFTLLLSFGASGQMIEAERQNILAKFDTLVGLIAESFQDGNINRADSYIADPDTLGLTSRNHATLKNHRRTAIYIPFKKLLKQGNAQSTDWTTYTLVKTDLNMSSGTIIFGSNNNVIRIDFTFSSGREGRKMYLISLDNDSNDAYKGRRINGRKQRKRQRLWSVYGA